MNGLFSSASNLPEPTRARDSRLRQRTAAWARSDGVERIHAVPPIERKKGDEEISFLHCIACGCAALVHPAESGAQGKGAIVLFRLAFDDGRTIRLLLECELISSACSLEWRA
jgi:hypothetical protein